MILAVVGSTQLNESQTMAAKFAIQGALEILDPTGFTSGGAKGVDTLGQDLFWTFRPDAKDVFIWLPEHPSWKGKGGLKGFEHRNRLIAETCDSLLRVVRKDSTTYGSGWTADRARELGKDVWEVFV